MIQLLSKSTFMISVRSWMRNSPPYLPIIHPFMFHFFKKKPSLHIPFFDGRNTTDSEISSLRRKERIFMIWAIGVTILLIVWACGYGFFYLKNHVFQLGIKAGEQWAYGRLYTSITQAGCRPININAPKESVGWDKISLLNMACFVQPQRSNSWSIIKNVR